MSLEAFQLNGKNALVTGSHRGLGAAIALALAKAGAKRGLPPAGSETESFMCRNSCSRP